VLRVFDGEPVSRAFLEWRDRGRGHGFVTDRLANLTGLGA
jgi:hypothetical protein